MNLFKPKHKTATDAIKYHLEKYGKIDQLECLKLFGVWRLSHYIHLFRKRGMDITSTEKKVKTRFGAETTVSVYHYKG